MSDLIDRQSVKEWLERWEGYLDQDMIARMQMKVDDIPTHPTSFNTLGALDCVDRQKAIDELIAFKEAHKADRFTGDFLHWTGIKAMIENLPSVQPELANNSPKLDKEIGECNDCIKHGGDWECDRVHCHKGDVSDTNVGESISRQAAINLVESFYKIDKSVLKTMVFKLKQLPSVQPKERCIANITLNEEDLERIVKEQVEEIKDSLTRKGKWTRREDGMLPIICECSVCGFDTTNFELFSFCPICGSRMGEGDSE